MAEEQLIAVLRAELSQFRAGMEEAARVAQTTMGRTQRASEEAARGFGGLERAMTAAKTALAAFGVTVGLGTLVKLGTDAVQAATRMQSLEAAMRAVSTSAGAAQQSLGFVRAESTRLGLDIESTTRSFTQLAASARGTRLEGAETQRVFTAVANASRVLGLSVAETGGALNAIQQIISKGTVQAEELRGQLGERLPGAFQIAARAIGVTTAELNKMLEQGRVISEDFLPRFARQLQQEFAPGAEAAARSAAASFTRLTNEIKVLSVEIGTNIISGLQPAVDFVTRTLQSLRRDREGLRAAQQEVTGSAPARLADIGDAAPSLRAEGERLRQQIEAEQRVLAQLVTQRERATTEAGRAAFEERIQQRTEALETLRKSYEALGKEIERVQQRFAEGGTEVTQIPFGAQAEGLQKILELMRKDLTALNMEFQLFGQGAGTDVGLEAAKKQLQEIEKTTAEVAKNLAANPRGLEAQVPAIRSTVEELQALVTTSRLRVKVLEEEEDTAQRVRQEQKQRAEEAARDEERLTRQRVDLLAEVEKAQEKQAASAAKGAFDEIKARTEANLALEEHLTLQEEAQKQLDILAGRAESRFEAERQRVKQRIADIEEVLGVTQTTQRALADNLARIRREETRMAEEELKKQNAAYEQFAESVQKTVGDRIFDVLSGRVRSFNDLLNSIRDTFLRVLADMAAAALARPIIIPAITAVLGAVGLGGDEATGASGTGGTSTLNALISAGKTGQQLYNLASKLGLFGGSAGSATLPASLTTTAPTAFYTTTPATAATLTSAPSAGAGSAASSTAATGAGISTALGAAGAGIGAGLIASQLFSSLGFGGTGNRVASGAIGGAVAGTVISPGIGTAIGAAVGALGGYLSTLFGGSRPPGVHIRGGTGTVPRFGLTEQGQLDLLTGLRPDVFTRGLGGQAPGEIGEAIRKVSIATLEPLVQTLRQFPMAFQQAAVGPLNDLSAELRQRFKDLRFSGNDVADQVKQFLEETLPQGIQETFAPLQQLLERLGPIFTDLQTAADALAQRRNEILGGFADVRTQLIEGTLTPDELFNRRRNQLTDLVASFRGATTEQRIALAPQAGELIADIFRQGQALFGQDREGLRALQQELLTILADVEGTTRFAFQTTREEIERQVEVLSASFAIQQNIDAGIQSAVELLQRIANLLTPVVSFQSVPGQFHTVQRTGLALVHEGELVGRPNGAPSITIHIDARGASDAGTIGRTTASAVRQTIRSLQQTSRYRQDRGL